MGLKALIQSATNVAFSALGDLPVSATVKYKTTKTFDPATQKNAWIYGSDTCSVIQYDFNSQEKLNEGVNESDTKILIQVAELTQAVEDYEIIIIGSKTWDIEKILLTESSESVVIYHGRLSNA